MAFFTKKKKESEPREVNLSHRLHAFEWFRGCNIIEIEKEKENKIRERAAILFLSISNLTGLQSKSPQQNLAQGSESIFHVNSAIQEMKQGLPCQ